MQRPFCSSTSTMAAISHILEMVASSRDRVGRSWLHEAIYSRGHVDALVNRQVDRERTHFPHPQWEIASPSAKDSTRYRGPHVAPRGRSQDNRWGSEGRDESRRAWEPHREAYSRRDRKKAQVRHVPVYVPSGREIAGVRVPSCPLLSLLPLCNSLNQQGCVLRR